MTTAPVARRRFLELLAGGGAGAAAAGVLGAPAAGAGPTLPPGWTPTFPHGVMAGDPAPDGAVIWTKVSRPPGDIDVPVLWEISDRPDFATVTTGGATTATSGSDWSVHG